MAQSKTEADAPTNAFLADIAMIPWVRSKPSWRT